MEEQIKRIVKEALDEFFANKPEKHPAVLDIKELSKYISKSDSWIRHNREILPEPISSKPLLWHRNDIDEWLETQRIKKPVKSTVIAPEFGKVNARRKAE